MMNLSNLGISVALMGRRDPIKNTVNQMAGKLVQISHISSPSMILQESDIRDQDMESVFLVSVLLMQHRLERHTERSYPTISHE